MDACAWVSPNFTPCTFSLCDLALYPFPVINFSREYNYALSPVSPPSKSREMGVVLGPPNTDTFQDLRFIPWGWSHWGFVSGEDEWNGCGECQNSTRHIDTLLTVSINHSNS